MDDIERSTSLPVDELVRLVRSVARPAFGQAVLDFVSVPGPLRNFGTFYCRDLQKRSLVMTIWSGAIGSYWFNRNARHIADTPNIARFVLEQMEACPPANERVALHRPKKGDSLFPMYQRAGLIDRCSVTTRTTQGNFHSFFLRSKTDGPVTAKQWDDYQSRLHIAQEFIILRHQIAGSEAFRHAAGVSLSSLRERGVKPFASLSLREAQVCDCIVDGLYGYGTGLRLGIAETTVRTLRQRAYRKLGIHSAIELMALLVKDANATATATKGSVDV